MGAAFSSPPHCFCRSLWTERYSLQLQNPSLVPCVAARRSTASSALPSLAFESGVSVFPLGTPIGSPFYCCHNPTSDQGVLAPLCHYGLHAPTFSYPFLMTWVCLRHGLCCTPATPLPPSPPLCTLRCVPLDPSGYRPQSLPPFPGALRFTFQVRSFTVSDTLSPLFHSSADFSSAPRRPFPVTEIFITLCSSARTSPVRWSRFRLVRRLLVNR